MPTGDGQGHGPDVGSDEWKSVIEFTLGIRDKPNLPSRGSETWCRHIDQIVRESRTSSGGGGALGGAGMARGPSCACDKVKAGSIEEMICEDKELSALDRKLSGVYAAASAKATNEHPPVLKAEQRGWIKGRNECWKSDDKRGCVRDEYQPRIAELQARYRLVPGNGPVRFMCDGNPANVDGRARRQRLADVLAAERQRRKVSGPQRDLLGPSRRSVDQVGYGAPEKRCKKAP